MRSGTIALNSHFIHISFYHFLPGSDWTHFIEIYPWKMEDLGDKCLKMMQMRGVAFSRLTLKKKLNSVEIDDDVDEKTVNPESKRYHRRVGLVFQIVCF